MSSSYLATALQILQNLLEPQVGLIRAVIEGRKVPASSASRKRTASFTKSDTDRSISAAFSLSARYRWWSK